MKGFTIKKLKKELEITKFEYNKEGFNYKFPNKKYFLNDFVMFKPELIEILIINSFNKKYRKILEFYLKTISEDDETTSGNLVIALDELSRLRTILLKKYNKSIRTEQLQKLLNELKILENEIRSKIFNISLIKNQEITNNIKEDKIKSR